MIAQWRLNWIKQFICLMDEERSSFVHPLMLMWFVLCQIKGSNISTLFSILRNPDHQLAIPSKDSFPSFTLADVIVAERERIQENGSARNLKFNRNEIQNRMIWKGRAKFLKFFKGFHKISNVKSSALPNIYFGELLSMLYMSCQSFFWHQKHFDISCLWFKLNHAWFLRLTDQMSVGFLQRFIWIHCRNELFYRTTRHAQSNSGELKGTV